MTENSLFYDAKTKQVKGLNGSGRSPLLLNLKKARELGLNGHEIPLKNLNSSVSLSHFFIEHD